MLHILHRITLVFPTFSVSLSLQKQRSYVVLIPSTPHSLFLPLQPSALATQRLGAWSDMPPWVPCFGCYVCPALLLFAPICPTNHTYSHPVPPKHFYSSFLCHCIALSKSLYGEEGAQWQAACSTPKLAKLRNSQNNEEAEENQSKGKKR